MLRKTYLRAGMTGVVYREDKLEEKERGVLVFEQLEDAIELDKGRRVVGGQS
jgi:SpoU rRNA methylase family enzyme